MNLSELRDFLPRYDAMPMNPRVPEPVILTPGQLDTPWRAYLNDLRAACPGGQPEPRLRLVEMERAQ